MNLQLVYRHTLSLSKNENMIKKKKQKNKTTKKLLMAQCTLVKVKSGAVHSG